MLQKTVEYMKSTGVPHQYLQPTLTEIEDLLAKDTTKTRLEQTQVQKKALGCEQDLTNKILQKREQAKAYIKAREDEEREALKKEEETTLALKEEYERKLRACQRDYQAKRTKARKEAEDKKADMVKAEEIYQAELTEVRKVTGAAAKDQPAQPPPSAKPLTVSSDELRRDKEMYMQMWRKRGCNEELCEDLWKDMSECLNSTAARSTIAQTGGGDQLATAVNTPVPPDTAAATGKRDATAANLEDQDMAAKALVVTDAPMAVTLWGPGVSSMGDGFYIPPQQQQQQPHA